MHQYHAQYPEYNFAQHKGGLPPDAPPPAASAPVPAPGLLANTTCWNVLRHLLTPAGNHLEERLLVGAGAGVGGQGSGKRVKGQGSRVKGRVKQLIS